MKNVQIVLWFDTEDYINPESDEALARLLKMLQARNIKASFNIVGERARVLGQRERSDILQGLREQEVGFHTDFHSVHPTIAEYLEPLGFKDGVLEYESRELQGFRDLQTVVHPEALTYSQPGGSYAPQAYPVLKHWGVKVNLGRPHPVSYGTHPFWYGGVLHITDIEMRMELEDGGLEAAKAQFEEIYDQAPDQQVTVVSIYYHPCEFSNTEFWDAVNFSDGRNPTRDEWLPAKHRSQKEMEFYVNELGNFIDFTLQKQGVSYVPASRVAALETEDFIEYSKRDVEAIASMVGDEIDFITYKQKNLSASEVLSLLLKCVDGQPLQAELLYGPETDIASEELGMEVTVDEIRQAIRSAAFTKVLDTRQIPDCFVVRGKQIRPADFAGTLAEIVRKGLVGSDLVTIRHTHLKSEDYVSKVDFNEAHRWIVFPEGFKTPNLLRISRLQSWTFKPLSIAI